MIERSYPEGNRLTLTLLKVLSSSSNPFEVGCVIVSIYEQSGHSDVFEEGPFFVRGHVVTSHRLASHFQERIAHIGKSFATLDDAREGARTMFGQLQAAHLSRTVDAESAINERIEQAIAAERAVIRAEVERRTPYAVNMIELGAWLDARSNGGAE